MDADLIALFKASNITDDIINKFTAERCTKVSLLAHWFEEQAEIKTFCESVDSAKGDVSQLAGVKLVIEKAKELTKAAVARAAQGMQDTPLDEPLPAEQHRNMVQVACALYRWMSPAGSAIDARTVVCDAQIARFRRELTVWHPQMIQFSKLRTLGQATKAPTAKRQKLGDGVSLQVGISIDDAYNAMDIITWPDAFAIIVKSWAIAGAFDVPEQKNSLTVCKMCEFSHADQYRLEFTHKIEELRKRYTDHSIIKSLCMTEEAFRAKAIELTRSEMQIPWGLSLYKVLNEHVQLWNIMRENLVGKTNVINFGQGGGQVQQGRSNSGWTQPNPSKGGASGKGKSKKGKGKGQKGKKGGCINSRVGETPFCRKFNDRHCSDANCRFIHQCNAKLTGGSACGKTDHGRKQHNPSQHGATQD